MPQSGYPVADTYGPALLRTIGSFWSSYFSDVDRLKMLFRGDGHLQGQTYLDFLEAVAGVSRFTIPVFHEEDWFLFVIKDSDRNNVASAYDEAGLEYDNGLLYDEPQTRQLLFPLPTGTGFFERLADIEFTIYNRVLYPSKTWTRGIDFDIDYDRNVIRFAEDPFESDYVARRDVYDDDGNLVDEEIGLWVYKGQFDLNYIYERYGFAVNLLLQSSEYYKEIMNAIWNGYVFGANMETVAQVISASLGIPLVLEPTETVEVVRAEPDRKLIITDKQVYEFSANAVPQVSVGDIVHAGESLVDAVEVVDVSGQTPDYSDIPALAFGDDFLSGGYFSELTFRNYDVTVEYLGVDEDGKAVVTFEVHGFPADVDRYFEMMQHTGKQLGNKTLAELLDTRANPVGQPTPEYLPSTINPLEFVLDTGFRNHVVLVKVKTSAIKDRAPGLGIINHLRDLIPPHTTYIVFVEVSPEADTMDLSRAGDETRPGVEEETDRFDGVVVDDEVLKPEAEASVDGASYEDVVLRVYRVSEVCA